MEKTKSPLLFLTNTEGVMTTNISGHRSWQKVEQNWTDLKINKEKCPSLFWKVILESDITAPELKTNHVKLLSISIHKEKFYASEHSPFTCIGASPETNILYIITNQETFQQFLQSLDEQALAEWTVIKMKRE